MIQVRWDHVNHRCNDDQIKVNSLEQMIAVTQDKIMK